MRTLIRAEFEFLKSKCFYPLLSVVTGVVVVVKVGEVEMVAEVIVVIVVVVVQR